METAKEITAWYKELEDGEFKPLFKQMDEDFDVWEMTPSPANISAYEVDVRNKTKEHGSEIEVVSNELRKNCDNIHSILSKADLQIMVKMAEAEGEDKRNEVGELERLFYFLLEQGDLNLRKMVLPTLLEQTNWCALVRGYRAARILNYKGSDDNIIANYTSLDPRWLVFEADEKGLFKVGYKTFKNREAIEREWDVKIPNTAWFKPWDKTGKVVEVIDYWKRLKPGVYGNKVVCEGVELKSDTYKIRSMPISIVPVATRPPIATTDGSKLRNYGQSIFATARNIHAVRNRFATIMANHANLKANQPLINYKSDIGKSIPPDAMFNVPGSVIELTLKENELKESPLQEMSQTEGNFMAWLSGQVEDTLLPPFRIENPAASGTRYALAAEAGNIIFNPQLRSLNYSYEDICKLIEEQLIDGGVGGDKIKKIKVQSYLKKEYTEITIKPVDLKKNHIIKVETTARNPWEQMDTAQIAQMLKGLGLPDEWLWENILKVRDPKLIKDLVALEVYDNSPTGAMERIVDALIRLRNDKTGALSLIAEMDRAEQEAAMGQGGQQPPPASPPPTGV
uniref:Uncharacterized protein n=1 Tax=viral metagenome TaxID=1070528 RepID=A0A6M3XVF3_9ZZZZ